MSEYIEYSSRRRVPVVGSVFPTNRNSAVSPGSCIRRRTTWRNCETFRSPGAKNLFLSISGISVERPDLSTRIGTRPGNRSRIRSDSSERSSNVDRVLNGIYPFGRGCIAFCIREVVDATSDILSMRCAFLLSLRARVWVENVRVQGAYDVFHRRSIKIL